VAWEEKIKLEQKQDPEAYLGVGKAQNGKGQMTGRNVN